MIIRHFVFVRQIFFLSVNGCTFYLDLVSEPRLRRVIKRLCCILMSIQFYYENSLQVFVILS